MPKFLCVYKDIALIVLNTAILLIVVNVVLWLVFAAIDAGRNPNQVGALEYDDDRLTAAYPDWDQDERDALLYETWSRPFVCLPFAHIRERAFSGEYVNVDEAWFRWNAEAPPWPPDENALNIFVFGGSTTFGYGVADHETIPSAMSQQLTEQHPGQAIQVYNFGQGTYFSSQQLRLFENLLLDGHIPDIAVFIDGINEVTTVPFGWYDIDCEHQDRVETVNEIPFELPVVRAARAVARRLFPQPDEMDDANAVSSDSDDNGTLLLNRYLLSREMIRSISDSLDIDVLFVWQPHPGFNYDASVHIFWDAPFPDFSVYPLMADLRDEWEKWPDFLYLADMQQDHRELLYVDRVHYNASFSAEIAVMINDALIERRWVQP